MSVPPGDAPVEMTTTGKMRDQYTVWSYKPFSKSTKTTTPGGTFTIGAQAAPRRRLLSVRRPLWYERRGLGTRAELALRQRSCHPSGDIAQFIRSCRRSSDGATAFIDCSMLEAA